MDKSLSNHVMDELESIDMDLSNAGFSIMQYIPENCPHQSDVATMLQSISHRLKMLVEHVCKNNTTDQEDNTNQPPHSYNNINNGNWDMDLTKKNIDKFTPHTFDSRISTEKRK